MTTRRRPRLMPDLASDRLSLRVTTAQRLEIRRIAADNQTNVSGMLREAIEEYVADYRDGRVFRPTK